VHWRSKYFRMSLSSIVSDEMAFRIMKTPSYTAVTAGVIHLIKCIPIDCWVRQDTECHELPVIYQNQFYFLASRSRILIKTGIQRDWNELLPIMFKIHNSWFPSMPRLVEIIPPSAYTSHVEIRKPSSSYHKRNLLNR